MSDFYKSSETLISDSKTLPRKYYTSTEVYQDELEHIFYDRWLCVGRQEKIQKPGDYFLQQVGQESIIILRDQQNRPNAFYNVCRHRGTRMCTQESGRFSASIQCPYHAWTYGLDGRLIGAPLMDEIGAFDKSAYPLHAVPTLEWEGFLFINLAHHPEPFEATFEALVGKFSAWNLQALSAARSIQYDVKANWKLIVQNYSECYHCPLIHPDLARKSPYRSGRNDLYAGPALGGYMLLDHDYGSLTLSGRACSAPLGNVTGDDLKRVYYYALFPNMLLSLHPDYVMCHTLWPQGAGETHIVCEWLFDAGSLADPSFDPDDAVNFWDMTNRQDWHVCELSQLGVSSRAYQPSPYSGQESLLAAFDQEYLKCLEGNQKPAFGV